MTHVNLNDGSCAGLAFPSKNLMSLQYHPEASPGPHDSDLGIYILLKSEFIFYFKFGENILLSRLNVYFHHRIYSFMHQILFKSAVVSTGAFVLLDCNLLLLLQFSENSLI